MAKPGGGEGGVEVNHQIVYYLQDALNLLPDWGAGTDKLGESVAGTSNDELLVVYLSSLVRAVVALHGLVDNKETIGRMEDGDDEDGEKGDKDKKKKDGEKEKDEKEKEKENKDEGKGKEKEKEKEKKDEKKGS
jgi:26S proteasome regulatory subunit N8